MLPADDLGAALAQEVTLHDERVSQYWDGKRVLGRIVSRILKLSAPIAWDVYLLYSPGATWKDGNLPVPDFWMHQLGERMDLRLDAGRLRTEVQKMIAAD